MFDSLFQQLFLKNPEITKQCPCHITTMARQRSYHTHAFAWGRKQTHGNVPNLNEFQLKNAETRPSCFPMMLGQFVHMFDSIDGVGRGLRRSMRSRLPRQDAELEPPRMQRMQNSCLKRTKKLFDKNNKASNCHKN